MDISKDIPIFIMVNKFKSKKMLSQINRCQFSGKVIGKKPAILVENAVLYLRKMGYLVSNFKFLILILGVFLVFPLVSAFDAQYTFDLDSRINMIISVCFLIGASVLAFMGKAQKMLSSFLFVIMGILFLFNGLNVILSFTLIALGVVIIFIK